MWIIQPGGMMAMGLETQERLALRGRLSDSQGRLGGEACGSMGRESEALGNGG